MHELLSKLRSCDLNIKDIHIYKSVFKNGNVVNHKNDGRKKHLIHFILTGKREYVTEKESFTLCAGTVLFIPEGTKYLTKSHECDGKLCSGIGICFDSDIDFKDVELKVYHTEVESKKQIKVLFEAVYNTYTRPITDLFLLKSQCFDLLSAISMQSTVNSDSYNLIKPALSYIQEHYTENLPIKAYADACNLSESYFRKIFSKYAGMSPIAYRNALRFTTAKEMYQNNFSTQEIAEKLGFCDAGYFLKTYKKLTHQTLKQSAKSI